MKDIFVVPSCIQPNMGVIDFEERYKQTLKTFESIRNKTEDSLIVLVDSSTHPLEEWKKEELGSKVDIFLDFSQDETAQKINNLQLKSFGENYLLLNGITYLKQHLDFKNLTGRMFKMGGRSQLLDAFDIREYDNTFGKYVFKKRLNSWMPKEVQDHFGSTHILETRFYSWCFSLVDEYVEIINKNFVLFNQQLDTEHSHFLNIPPDKLIEFDMLNVGMTIALNGHYMVD